MYLGLLDEPVRFVDSVDFNAMANDVMNTTGQSLVVRRNDRVADLLVDRSRPAAIIKETNATENSNAANVEGAYRC